MKDIQLCDKACVECGFTKDGTKDTLYAEFFNIISKGIFFPCHMYLKSNTGSENSGTETLDTIKVCRGYVAFVKKNFCKEDYNEWDIITRTKWFELLKQIDDIEFKNILTVDEIMKNHKGLREGVYLGN